MSETNQNQTEIEVSESQGTFLSQSETDSSAIQTVGNQESSVATQDNSSGTFFADNPVAVEELTVESAGHNNVDSILGQAERMEQAAKDEHNEVLGLISELETYMFSLRAEHAVIENAALSRALFLNPSNPVTSEGLEAYKSQPTKESVKDRIARKKKELEEKTKNLKAQEEA